MIWDWAESQKTPLSIPEGGAFLAFDPQGTDDGDMESRWDTPLEATVRAID